MKKEDLIIGVYRIKNMITGEMYIGRSVDVKTRWRVHRRMLAAGDHHSSKLQKSVNAYGISNFDFAVLERCSDDKIIEREEFWINKEDSVNCGLNSYTSGGSIGWGKSSATYDHNERNFYHIDGREVCCTRYDLTKNNNLNDGHMSQLIYGDRDSHGGWYIDKDKRDEYVRTHFFTFYHIDGTVEDNVTQDYMVKKYGLDDAHISKVVICKAVQTMGWHTDFEKMKKSKKAHDRRTKTHKFQNIESGEIVELTSPAFSKLIKSNHVYEMIEGSKYKQVKGWTLVSYLANN